MPKKELGTKDQCAQSGVEDPWIEEVASHAAAHAPGT